VDEIIQGIFNCQLKQDREGHEHPGQSQTFTFRAPFWIRLYLRLRGFEGLTFDKYAGEWWGVFRAQK
jgi:hypothetical protein